MHSGAEKQNGAERVCLSASNALIPPHDADALWETLTRLGPRENLIPALQLGSFFSVSNARQKKPSARSDFFYFFFIFLIICSFPEQWESANAVQERCRGDIHKLCNKGPGWSRG